MQRKMGTYGSVLTYAKGCEIKEAKAHLKALEMKLRREAIKHSWAFIMIAVFSTIDGSTGRSVPPHFHVLIIGTPSSVISDCIKKYWDNKHGIAMHETIELSEGDFIGYMERQASFMWTRDVNMDMEALVNDAQSIEEAVCEHEETLASCYIENNNIHDTINNIIMGINKVVKKVSGWTNLYNMRDAGKVYIPLPYLVDG